MVKRKHSTQRKLRIIGGQLRGRNFLFPEIEGLRPTPDRIRETLFNWLSPIIYDSVCLDLFTGSGALSFEAISRGAKKVISVDSSPEVISYLKKNAKIFSLHQLNLYHEKIPATLPVDENSIDIVFLDPPFHKNMIELCSNWLEKTNWLKPNTTIYIEVEKELEPLPVPKNWEIVRSKKAGQIAYYLMERRG